MCAFNRLLRVLALCVLAICFSACTGGPQPQPPVRGAGDAGVADEGNGSSCLLDASMCEPVDGGSR